MTGATTPAAPGHALRQSLAHGPLGVALLDIERARRGTGDWATVHRRLASVGPLVAGPEAGLFLGAPAMAFVLHLAAADSHRYANALTTLDTIVAAHTRRRLDAAHRRIDQGRPTSFAEYDLLRGLTGIGALLLHRAPEGLLLRDVLRYLVRLTEPVNARPGWSVWHGPTNLDSPAPGGHANAGLAHGIAGPLALLALATCRGITVPGQHHAMRRVCHWLDRIRDPRGSHWPRWVSAAGTDHGPANASWCYGTPGLARAQQLAALALGDDRRQREAERALLDCLNDPQQLDRLTDRGLCHGVAGLLRTTWRVAQDAKQPGPLTEQLPCLAERFRALPPAQEVGFFEGTTGEALASHAGGMTADWDACLLLS